MANTEVRLRYYTFDLSQLEPFELGAAATVIMCWPDPSDENKRGEMHEKIAAALLRKTVGVSAAALQTRRPMKPVYAFRNVERDVEHMARLDDRLESVMVFGHRVIPFLKRAENGSAELLPGIKKPTMASLVRAIEDETKEPIDNANFRQRDWLPWLPVAHLAAGARIFVQTMGWDRFEIDDWWEMMTDAWLITAWLGQARLLEPLVLRAFPKVGPQLARIRLTEVSFPTTN